MDEASPEAEQIVLVVANLKTHAPACLYERFSPQEAPRMARKIAWHYTPEYGSWLKIAACELSILERQYLARRLPDVDTLKREVTAWEHRHNQAHITIDWRFTTADGTDQVKAALSCYQRIKSGLTDL